MNKKVLSLKEIKQARGFCAKLNGCTGCPTYDEEFAVCMLPSSSDAAQTYERIFSKPEGSDQTWYDNDAEFKSVLRYLSQFLSDELKLSMEIARLRNTGNLKEICNVKS